MKIIYYSLTGNVRRFIQRAGLSDTMALTEANKTNEINEPFIMVTGTMDSAKYLILYKIFESESS